MLISDCLPAFLMAASVSFATCGVTKPSFSEWQKDLFRFAERHGIAITKRYAELTPAQRKLLWDGTPDDRTFLGVRGCFADLARYKYKLHVRVFIRRYQNQSLCLTCKGSRLTPDALDAAATRFLGTEEWYEKTFEVGVADAASLIFDVDGDGIGGLIDSNRDRHSRFAVFTGIVEQDIHQLAQQWRMDFDDRGFTALALRAYPRTVCGEGVSNTLLPRHRKLFQTPTVLG